MPPIHQDRKGRVTLMPATEEDYFDGHTAVLNLRRHIYLKMEMCADPEQVWVQACFSPVPELSIVLKIFPEKGQVPSSRALYFQAR